LTEFYETIRLFLAAIGAFITAGGTIVLLAFGVFKKFGENWLNAKFNERLEAFRHVQQKELEELRFRINSLFDRKTKLHQKEYEVIPGAWARIADAHGVVTAFTSFLQSYADVGRMTDSQLEEFLSDSKLLNWQRSELKAADRKDRNKYYQDVLFYHTFGDCRRKCRKSYVYLQRNGIFMPRELLEKFRKFDGMVWAALNEHQSNKELDEVPRRREAANMLRDEGGPLFSELEETIQKRLWNDKLDEE
jgi:hypothetical protein